MESIRDLRLAIRALKKAPSFALSVVLTLALAVGVTTATLSAIEAVLLQPMPHVRFDNVITIESNDATHRLAHLGLDPWEMSQLARRRDLFEAVAGYRLVSGNLVTAGGGAAVEAISIGCTTPQFFNVFGVRPLLGSLYDSVGIVQGGSKVVVLGYDFWRRDAGSSTAIMGKMLTIDGSSYRVIGVLPEGFRFPTGAEVWTPQPLDFLIAAGAAETPRFGLLLPTVARVRAGVSASTVHGALSAAALEWAAEFRRFFATVGSPSLTTRPLIDFLAGPLRSVVFVLEMAAALLLITACANIASLQLVRATGRAKEVALRRALGASRIDLVRYQLAESFLIAVAGALLGIALGALLVSVVRQTTNVQLADLQTLRIDPRVLAGALAVTTAAALVSTMAPALRLLSTGAADALRVGGARTSSSGIGRGKFLRGAVVTQVAMSLVLMLCACVTLMSFRRVMQVDPGFRPDGLLTARVSMQRNFDDAPQHRMSTHLELLRELEGIPGFVAATTADAAPFSFVSDVAAATHRIALSARADTAGQHKTTPANVWSVDGSYFRTMGIPFVQGTTFSDADLLVRIRDYQSTHAPAPAVIDEALARRLYPNEPPIGKIIGPGNALRVVGVVAPTHQSDLAAPMDDAGTIYLANAAFRNDLTIIVRSRLPFAESVSRLRQAIARFDPQLAPFDIAPLSDVIDRSVEARKLAARVLAILGGLALALAALGIYGVISYATTERVPEIGIRMAVGATPRNILAMILRGGLTLVVVGAGAGLVAFIGVSRLLGSLVFGISASNPSVLVVPLLLLQIVALAAIAVPAARAASVEPMKALKQ